MKRVIDQVKQKVDGEEIDSITILVNEMYERFKEMHHSGGLHGPLPRHSATLNPNLLAAGGDSSLKAERRASTTNVSGKDLKAIKEI